ncbi:MAG: hypothetical protein V3T33_09640 [Myxococcota bacterium]
MTSSKDPEAKAQLCGRLGGGLGVGVGVDMGATLAKIAIRESSKGSGNEPSPETRFELLPAGELHTIVQRVEEVAPVSVGLTGGGAVQLAERLPCSADRVNEFAAWGTGAARLMEGQEMNPQEPYLLVSVGTGTSVLLIDGISVVRTGGTALGGGTLMGLAAALLGKADFEDLCRLAERGRRSAVDLLVSDIYRAGEIPLGGDITASCFGKLALTQRGGDGPGCEEASSQDLAAALMGLVGENVALICGGLAAAAQVREIVFAGCTLRSNPALESVIGQVTRALGRRATFLPDGEFAGALGGLELAQQRS